MKNSKIIKLIFGATALFLLWHFFLRTKPNLAEQVDIDTPRTPTEKTQAREQIKKTSDASNSKTSSVVPASGKNSNANRVEFNPQNAEEESIQQMHIVLEKAFLQRDSSRVLIRELEAMNLVPQVARDSNPYTGEMVIVRAKNNLPGTRYLHAQYFTDENGKEFLQHFSYETKGGPQAFERNILATQARFNLGEPIRKTKDFAQWNLTENMEVWVKVLSKDDLLNDPVNAYTDQDVGVVRIAIEKKIHEDGAHDHD